MTISLCLFMSWLFLFYKLIQTLFHFNFRSYCFYMRKCSVLYLIHLYSCCFLSSFFFFLGLSCLCFLFFFSSFLFIKVSMEIYIYVLRCCVTPPSWLFILFLFFFFFVSFVYRNIWIAYWNHTYTQTNKRKQYALNIVTDLLTLG